MVKRYISQQLGRGGRAAATSPSLFTSLTSDVAAKRNQFKGRLDEFCRFYWQDEDAFEKFGAFIITDSLGDLKFHSGPTWSNDYSQPQYGSYGDLLGVNFSTWSISLKIGLYAISEDDWRRFLLWMSPFTVGWLRFGYDGSKWQYQCKVASITEGSRYSLFHDSEGIERYYGETTVKFEIVGNPVAYSVAPLEFRPAGIESNQKSYDFKLKKTSTYEQRLSDLNYPLDMQLSCDLNKIFKNQSNSNLLITVTTTFQQITAVLFSVSLSNLSYYNPAADTTTTDKQWQSNLNIYYSSETGLLFYNFGDSPIRLLSYQEAVSTGERLVTSRKAIKFKWPGRFTNQGLNNAANIQDYTIACQAAVGADTSSPKYCSWALYDGSSTTPDISLLLTGRSQTNVV